MSAPGHDTATNTAVARSGALGTPVSATVPREPGDARSTITRRTEHPAGGPARVVVTVTDDVDHDSAPILRATLAEALDSSPRVCCDLGAVTFFGAAGAAALRDTHRMAQARGAEFTVRGARGLTRQILDFVGLATVLRPRV